LGNNYARSELNPKKHQFIFLEVFPDVPTIGALPQTPITFLS
jgi:hypothetical protein